MTHIEFFKLQAKNLLRDYKTQYHDKEGLPQYEARIFNDIDDIVFNCDINEDGAFTLMNAQHAIATLAGFSKWGDLLKASEVDQEIGKLLFANRNYTGGVMTNIVRSVIVEDWKNYSLSNKLDRIDAQTRLKVFKEIFLPAQIELSDPDVRSSLKMGRRSARKKLTKEYYLANNPFHCNNWNSNVECIHCDTQFLFNNAEIDEDGLIICPVKDCDGTLIDFQVVASHSKKWTPKRYKELAQELAGAMKPLAKIGTPLTVDFAEEVSEGLEPKLLDSELEKLGYVIRFKSPTAMDVMTGRAKELMDNFGQKFEVWVKGEYPEDDEENFFRGMEGFGVFEGINKTAGRNSPCPCNSGRKFKQCCGGVTNG